LVDLKGSVLYGAHSKDRKVRVPSQKAGNILEAQFQTRIPFTPGNYFASFGITDQDGEIVYDRRLDALHFIVQTSSHDFKPESLVNLKAEVRVRDLTNLLQEGDCGLQEVMYGRFSHD